MNTNLGKITLAYKYLYPFSKGGRLLYKKADSHVSLTWLPDKFRVIWSFCSVQEKEFNIGFQEGGHFGLQSEQF